MRIEVNSAENAFNVQTVTPDAAGGWLLRIKADGKAPSSMLFSAACGADSRSVWVRMVAVGDSPTSTSDAALPVTTPPDEGSGGFPWWLLLLALAVAAALLWRRRRRETVDPG